ncbi:PREDICTED: centromere protein X [Ipomoea nil]|uniref:centromere protein X n=1 Tax=Ipomoea nil TaxID=35883 RepID=UPI0009015B91|nr:PREDICTED: centromere protein X [Ipomoea nil]XP_019185034.1 PREDICTED: centromere protein X [Ipomoea nil]XP_019185035.1 PREDICTED: centromere protein X [Ipomoea nil]
MEIEKNCTFDPDLVHEIFKLVWRRRAADREKNELPQTMDTEIVGAASASRKNRPTFANATALKLSCELLRVFVAEAVQRAAAIAEAEGTHRIEATHLERILPQLLLDF